MISSNATVFASPSRRVEDISSPREQVTHARQKKGPPILPEADLLRRGK